jgi:hypothetical protein
MGVALREGGLTPTSPLLILHYPAARYGSALTELNPALTPLSVRWCVQKSYRQVDPPTFRLGKLMFVGIS